MQSFAALLHARFSSLPARCIDSCLPCLSHCVPAAWHCPASLALSCGNFLPGAKSDNPHLLMSSSNPHLPFYRWPVGAVLWAALSVASPIGLSGTCCRPSAIHALNAPDRPRLPQCSRLTAVKRDAHRYIVGGSHCGRLCIWDFSEASCKVCPPVCLSRTACRHWC